MDPNTAQDATTPDAVVEDVKDDAPRCVRHSYPRGTKAGDGRTCKRCGHCDGALPPGTSADTASAPPDATLSSAAEFLPALPEHSPLGASSFSRWSKCPGSVALIEALQAGGQGGDDDEPDWTRDGTQAHALAAHCLENDIPEAWQALVNYPDLTADMMQAVQVYLDFVRSLPSRLRFIEHKMHRPEFHPSAFGTGDYISVHCLDEVIDFVDYKHGQGVLVDVEDNGQLKYYVYLFIGENVEEYPDTTRVRLHIVQPRANHPDGPIRTWETTAFEIRDWAQNVLRPAMDRVATDRYLEVGEHCRFCPALKALVCPVHAVNADALHRKLANHDPEKRLQLLDDEALGDWYSKSQLMKMYIRKIEEETYKRVMAGAKVPGAKAVKKITDRVWKAEAPVEVTFGKEAWQPPKLRSPAQVKDLPGGKEFIAEWAYQPDAGLTVAPASDRRAEQIVQTDAQKYAGILANLG